jgi:hypothetical protein
MGKQLALGSVLGAIVLFVWSAIAWMLVPWPGEPLRTFTNDEAVAQAIKANAPRSGNYLLPNEPKRTPGMTDQQYKATEQAAQERMARGPIVFASVRLEPFGSMGKALVIKFLTQLIVALIATILVLQAGALSYSGRVGFFTAIGIIIFVGANVDEWNWWGFSNAYTVMQLGVILIGWFLAGLVVAKFVVRKTSAGAVE